MKERITPEYIKMLDVDDVFVFGSNEMGSHAGGAAFDAYTRWGAMNGVGFGHMGQTFAIPTIDWLWSKLGIREIRFYVRRFIQYAAKQCTTNFYVTKIGCGIAGYDVDDIAPLFKGAKRVNNIYLPQEFWDFYEEENKAKCNKNTNKKLQNLQEKGNPNPVASI